MSIKTTTYGFLARLINVFIKLKPKHWVFGADFGNMYREGSKYLLEYMLQNHPDFHCTFITLNKDVKKELDAKGIPCELNTSIRGIITVAQADAIFTTQTPNDVRYAYKKQGRSYYYLVHGQPLKIAMSALEESEIGKKIFHQNIFQRIKYSIANIINYTYRMSDVSFVSATSEFLRTYMEIDFGNKLEVKILGMPRNDGLFDTKRMNNERWIKGLEEKFIITYMPTHRAYGKGKVTPTPFKNRPDIQKWMIENNVVLLMKNHPNMIKKVKETDFCQCIIDITKQRLDPQVCIYHSDVLVTDFSSVWMDYLLLKRPIIFYIYDDFENSDVGCHYDIRQEPPGHFCYNEDEFFLFIKQIKENYDKMRPSDYIVHKYHKYVDGKSCERYYNEIYKEKYY